MYMFFKTIDFDMLLQTFCMLLQTFCMLLQTFLHGISSVYTFNYMQVREMPLPSNLNNVETK